MRQSTKPLHLPITVAEIAYLAGIFDGEGTVITKRHKGREYGHVAIANCDEALISWLASLGGGVTVTTHPRTDTRTCYSWYVSKSVEVVAFLEALMPYLIIKRERAVILIEKLRSLPHMQEQESHAA